MTPVKLALDPNRSFDLLTSQRAMEGQSIRCRVCGLVSHHPEDVKRRYCGYCHQFHDVLTRLIAEGALSPMPNLLPIIGYNSDGAAPVFSWPGGMQTTAIPMLLGRGRVIGLDPPDYWINPATGVEDGRAGISRFWCFELWVDALLALLRWKPTETPEPDGWVKSYDERRRIQGDARYEYRTYDEEVEVRRRFLAEQENNDER